jgi:peptidyl-prolyl cis-trans isomerase B (cyclophilin B)
MNLRLPIFALIFLLAGCGSSSKVSAIPNGSGTTSATTASTSTAAQTSAPAGCTAVQAPQPKPDGTYKKPTTKLNPARTYTATVVTNCGTFAFRLNVKQAPHVSASIAYLARRKFFDNTIFHRIVPGFVIQGGDPTGTGSGGPGYSTVDKPPKNTTYKTGVVAMAKTAAEAPGTAGSQFFVVTGADAGLPPDYAVLGKVTKGANVVQRIGKLGDQSEKPTTTVLIKSFRVTSS